MRFFACSPSAACHICVTTSHGSATVNSFPTMVIKVVPVAQVSSCSIYGCWRTKTIYVALKMQGNLSRIVDRWRNVGILSLFCDTLLGLKPCFCHHIHVTIHFSPY